MADKYLKAGTSGFAEEVEAKASSAGAGDAGKVVALDAAGRIDNSMMPVGIGADTKSIVASETLAAGDFVNVWNDSGTLKVRKADASGGIAKKVDGFVLAVVTSGNNATVYFEGTNNQRTGLTVGSNYFLSATPGSVTTTPPTTAAHICQYVGVALSATEISFEPSDPIVRA